MNDVHLVVALGDDRYALPVASVHEVVRVGRLTPVPGSPQTVLGIINLRGEIVTVVDSGKLLGVQGGGGSAESVVVVEAGGLRAGLAVEKLVDVVSLPLGLEPTDAPALRGSSLFGGDLVGVVDVSALLGMVGAGELP